MELTTADLMTAADAHTVYGIPPGRLRQWVYRGRIVPTITLPPAGKGRPPHVYHVDDLWSCLTEDERNRIRQTTLHQLSQ